MNKFKVGILGATGIVGQTLATHLEQHPFFELSHVMASSENAHKKYNEVLQRKGMQTIQGLSSLILSDSYDHWDCDWVFSCLGSSEAVKVEPELVRKGFKVISLSSAYRNHPLVPVVIPEINPHHYEILKKQQSSTQFASQKGFLVCKPNCSLQSFVLPLHAIGLSFIKNIQVVTLQSMSGAGWNGLSPLQMMDNVIPYIADEEGKTEMEPLKIWGTCKETGIHSYETLKIKAQCNRVPVTYGHMASVWVETHQKVDQDQIITSWNHFKSVTSQLPSGPLNPIMYQSDLSWPQPQWELKRHNMSILVGRLEVYEAQKFKFVGLSHNIERGAARGALLIAEQLLKLGY